VRGIFLGAIVACLATACTAAPDDTALALTFDPCGAVLIEPAADVTASEGASIDDALALWNAELAVTASRTTSAVIRPTPPVLAVRFEDAAPVFHGIYLDDIGEVVINRGIMDPGIRAVVVAHELGHAFGLLHVEDRDSVMNPGNLAVVPNADDAAALFALWPSCASP